MDTPSQPTREEIMKSYSAYAQGMLFELEGAGISHERALELTFEAIKAKGIPGWLQDNDVLMTQPLFAARVLRHAMLEIQNATLKREREKEEN